MFLVRHGELSEGNIRNVYNQLSVGGNELEKIMAISNTVTPVRAGESSL